ncbi:MAG: AAA family ATPase [Phycisphaerales bacterium]|nr:MAG: AAA family ATPase [Phycisphaerales bacterium]
MRTIAVLNQKGGVGKTTTTVNTAAALAAMGLKVIVIDLDPQAHLTIHLGVEPQTMPAGAYDVMTQSAEFEQSLMLTRPNLWLLGANINLVGAETELVSVVGREIILREAMHRCHEQFDFCLIDCAPSLGLLSLNALAASQEVLIPLQPHFLALQGFGKLLQTIDLVNKRINRDLKVTGVLLCMFDTRASLPNEVRADIDRFLTNARGSNSAWADAQILPTFIRRNIKLAEAPSYGQTIFEYDPTCNGAADYRNVARFFLGIEPRLDGQDETESEVESEPETAAAPDPVVEHEPQEIHHDPEPTGGADPVMENETVSEAPSPDAHHEPELLSNPDPAPQRDTVPAPWDLQHRPESEFGAGSAIERGPVPEQAPSESHHELESADEHNAEARQETPEHPPIQIQEFQLPAPQTYSPRPFQDEPASPASPPEPAPAHHDEAPNEPHQSHDEPEQIGF